VLICFICFVSNGLAQNVNVDTLKIKVNAVNLKSDTLRINSTDDEELEDVASDDLVRLRTKYAKIIAINESLDETLKMARQLKKLGDDPFSLPGTTEFFAKF